MTEGTGNESRGGEGIIPLRPLAAAEILGGAFTALRRNPKPILALSAALAVITGVLLGVGSGLAVVRFFDNLGISMNSGNSPRLERGVAVLEVLAVLCAAVGVASVAVLAGLLSATIGQAVLGRKDTPAVAWRTARARLGSVAATVLLSGVVVALGMAVAVGVAAAIGFAAGIGTALIPLGLLAGGVFALVVTVRWSVALPAVVLEHARPGEALRRSRRLVRGSAWRVLWVLVLAAAIVLVTSGIILAPFELAGWIASLALGEATAVYVIAVCAGAVIAAAVTAPVLSEAVVLLYVDLRMRGEGPGAVLESMASSIGRRGAQ